MKYRYVVERVKCAACGRIGASRMPRGGDGTLLYPRRHRTADGREECAGNTVEAIYLNQSMP